LSRFYQNLTEDTVRNKNHLHKVLQSTFPELEHLLSTPSDEQYWNLVIRFPTVSVFLKASREEVDQAVRHSTSKRISEKRVSTLADKILELAHQSYPAISLFSPMLDEVRYYA
jgi:hypothetical protein